MWDDYNIWANSKMWTTVNIQIDWVNTWKIKKFKGHIEGKRDYYVESLRRVKSLEIKDEI